MLKNEENVIIKTLKSLLDTCCEVIIYDTGSTDNTIKKIKDYSSDKPYKLYIKQGEFSDFASSRNVLLEYANSVSESDYYLLLDANDEIRYTANSYNLKILLAAIEALGEHKDCFLLKQVWNVGTHKKEYFNNRLIKKSCNAEYVSPVHEYLKIGPKCTRGKIKNSVYIYQDRTKDCKSSRDRWPSDLKILLKHHAENPSNERTVYYIAQTYECLKDEAQAKIYYEKRSKMRGFYEERFWAMMKMAKMSSDKLKWAIAAFEVMKRVEPLIIIAEEYEKSGNKDLALVFIEIACTLDFPSQCNLHVDIQSYETTRFEMLKRLSSA